MTRFFMNCAVGACVAAAGGSASATPLTLDYIQAVASGSINEPAPKAATVADATTVLERLAAPAYEDGFGSPADLGRPNPRVLSNTLSVEENRTVESAPLSNLAVAFSQLIASHEIARSPTDASEPINVEVSATDPVAVEIGGVPVMLQDRSQFVGGTGVGDPREQLNDVTQAFDGSTVYGSDLETENLLRTNDGTGQLKVDPGDGGLPIINGRRRAGDVRADENVALQALHTLFLSEHNRLAAEIAADCTAAGLSCSGDEIFEGAKAIVAAQQEHIFYNEFLPIFLGTDDIAALVPDQSLLSGPAGVLNEFTAAAGRVGHTQVPETITAGLPGGPIASDPIAECLFSSTCVQGASLDELMFGAGTLEAEAIDLFVVDGLRNGQIPGFNATFLIDLLATNINRGRDHGIADYEAVRAALGFAPASLDDLLPDAVLDAYGATPVDLLVGLFAEEKAPGAYLGETAAALWALQFELLRPTVGLLSGQFASMFDDLSMASLIAANTSLEASDFGVSAFLAPAPVPVPPSGLALAAGIGVLVLRRKRARPGAS